MGVVVAVIDAIMQVKAEVGGTVTIVVVEVEKE